eukprot:1087938-Prorocentrum_minimum.AAC.3
MPPSPNPPTVFFFVRSPTQNAFARQWEVQEKTRAASVRAAYGEGTLSDSPPNVGGATTPMAWGSPPKRRTYSLFPPAIGARY